MRHEVAREPVKLSACLSPSRHGVFYFRWPLPSADRQGRRPEFVFVDAAPRLASALVALRRNDLPIRRRTVYTQRTLRAHAPKHMDAEQRADCRDEHSSHWSQDACKHAR